MSINIVTSSIHAHLCYEHLNRHNKARGLS